MYIILVVNVVIFLLLSKYHRYNGIGKLIVWNLLQPMEKWSMIAIFLADSAWYYLEFY